MRNSWLFRATSIYNRLSVNPVSYRKRWIILAPCSFPYVLGVIVRNISTLTAWFPWYEINPDANFSWSISRTESWFFKIIIYGMWTFPKSLHSSWDFVPKWTQALLISCRINSILMMFWIVSYRPQRFDCAKFIFRHSYQVECLFFSLSLFRTVMW